VLISDLPLISHRSDFKEKNHLPAGVGIKLHSNPLPKQLQGARPSTNEDRIPISPMSTTEVIVTKKTFFRAMPVSTPPQPVSSGNHQRSSLQTTNPTSNHSSANLRRSCWLSCHLPERVSIRPGFFSAIRRNRESGFGRRPKPPTSTGPLISPVGKLESGSFTNTDQRSFRGF
jgi:hypothetical protein